MKLSLLTGSVAVAATLAAAPAAAQSSASDGPLAGQIDPRVKSCRQMDTLKVPLRSSGADVVTVYGNGYEDVTPDDSVFGRSGVSVEIELQNDPVEQLRDYLSCETPIMHGTQGMLNSLADLTEEQAKTSMVAVYQTGWSNGGAALVGRPNVSNPADLNGATIAVQGFGPHTGLVAQVLSDARESVENDGGTWREPDFVYTDDLLGLGDGTPGRAFLPNEDIDAAFVTKADADILTSGGKVGTGAEGSVTGAEIVMTTKSANRVISDVIVVRKDYYNAHTEQVKDLVQAMLKADEKVREDIKKQIVEWDSIAGYLLEDSGAGEEAKQLWRDFETVGLAGNQTWAKENSLRGWKRVNNDIQSYLVEAGLLRQAHGLEIADWDWQALGADLFDRRFTTNSLDSFNQNKAASKVKEMQDSGEIDKRKLFDFEINFKPNEQEFPIDDYRSKFQDVIEKASRYSGAVMTIEGHSSPVRYLKTKFKMRQAGEVDTQRLKQIRQSALNLSYRRAQTVRKQIVRLAEQQGVALDESQFVTTGLGIKEPKTGMCGQDPCAPQTKAEWLSNMRVTFKMVRMKAEDDVFQPPNTW